MTDKKLTLDERLAALPTDIAPPVELWGKIDALLPAEDSRSPSETDVARKPAGYGWRSLYAVAAAALFVAVTLGVVRLELETPDATGKFVAAPVFPVDGMDTTQLVAVRNNLHQSLELALDELSPKTRQTVVENLARIDAARKEIDTALQQEPNNTLLQQMLLSSYTSEITLLGEFTAMAQSAPQRTRL